MAESPNRVEEIYYAATQKLAKAERLAYLDAACGGDSALRGRVEELLEANDAAGDLLEAPAFEVDVTLDTSPVVEGPGSVIGPYKLLEKIGEGGMAVVYMAEQERPLRRRVALKIIKLGMDTRSVIARFEIEREALALMDHPNIAKVFDAGATETGRPYFVMELVRGVSITEYCDMNKLDTQERLALFIPVCHAVQHAHQKGIIHRDIKPSNIMVTLHDGIPVPKVIDFGIAKATNQRLTERTIFTRYAELIGTPEYMSPEQAEMSGLDIDTRTDIYSLGVVLYELLTGALPFDEGTLRSAALGEIQRIIREVEPPRPSTRLSALGERAKKIAESRRTDTAALTRRLRSELEWIPLKALRKDRTRRYRSVSELADDVQNYLKGRPLIAGPESTAYRLRKFLWRHRVPVGLTSAIVLALMVGLSVLASQHIRVKQARNQVTSLEEQVETDRQLATAQRLYAEGSYQAALAQIEGSLLNEEPEPKTRLLYAQLLLLMARNAEAEPVLQELTHAEPAIAGPAHCLLAQMYLVSDPVQAEEQQRQAESKLSKTADAYCLRAVTAGTPEAMLRWLSQALELDPSHYPSRKARAVVYYEGRTYDRMEQDAEAMIALRPQDHLGYALRGIARREQGRFEEALEDHSRALELCQAHSSLCEYYDHRRETSWRMGRFEAALEDARQCYALEKNAYYAARLMAAMLRTGDLQQACELYGQVGPLARNTMRLAVGQALAAPGPQETLGKGEGVVAEMIQFCMQEFQDTRQGLRARATPLSRGTWSLSTWSPDGKKIAYGRSDFHGRHGLGSAHLGPAIWGLSRGVEILDVQSGQTRLLVGDGKDPAWSPDGRFIAFVRSPGYVNFEEEEVWLVPAEGGEPRRIASGGGPHWSGDSGRLFIQSRTEKMLYAVDIRDPRDKPVPVMACPAWYPRVSPDGRRVAYAVPGRLSIVDLASGAELTGWAFPGGNLPLHVVDWAPNGRVLTIGAYDYSYASGLWIYDCDSARGWHVLGQPVSAAHWSPDQSRLTIDAIYPIDEIWTIALDPTRPTQEAFPSARTREDYLRDEWRRYEFAFATGTSFGSASIYLLALAGTGLDQLQGGHRQEGIATIDHVERMHEAYFSNQLIPDYLVCMIEAYHWLGQRDRVRQLMDRLRRECRENRYSDDRYLCKAETVLAEGDPDLHAAWGLLATGKLAEVAPLVGQLQKKYKADGPEKAAQVSSLAGALSRSAHRLANDKMRAGTNPAQAIEAYQMAAAFDPNNDRVLSRLAWLLATCPQDECRSGEAAREYGTQACEVTRWQDPLCISALAAAHAELGQFAQAVELQRRALALSGENVCAGWKREMAERLVLYQSESHLHRERIKPLAAWLRLDETDGSVLRDSSGNGLHAKLVGSPHRVEGRLGPALDFASTEASIECAYAPALEITDQIAICCWIRPGTYSESWRTFLERGGDSWRLVLAARGTVNFEFYTAPSPKTVIWGNVSIGRGSWHHIAAVYDGMRAYLYVDGKLDSSKWAPGRLARSTQGFRIAPRTGGPGASPWNGGIDDVRIHNYAISEAEVKKLAERSNPETEPD